jgi:hypothetical protein
LLCLIKKYRLRRPCVLCLMSCSPRIFCVHTDTITIYANCASKMQPAAGISACLYILCLVMLRSPSKKPCDTPEILSRARSINWQHVRTYIQKSCMMEYQASIPMEILLRTKMTSIDPDYLIYVCLLFRNGKDIPGFFIGV